MTDFVIALIIAVAVLAVAFIVIWNKYTSTRAQLDFTRWNLQQANQQLAAGVARKVVEQSTASLDESGIDERLAGDFRD